MPGMMKKPSASYKKKVASAAKKNPQAYKPTTRPKPGPGVGPKPKPVKKRGR